MTWLSYENYLGKENNMKRLFVVNLILVIVLALSSFAMAKKDTQFTCPPTNLTVDTTDPAAVCFAWDWECEGTPLKYSIDVELLVSGEGWDDPLADIQELSFGTGDRTDGEALDATFLCVPIEAFQYWDGDSYEPFVGDAAAKVKALGKGPDFRQNNTFSSYTEFSIE